MKIFELRPQPRSKHKKKRVGRGSGSGHGGTSCRGHKGQLSRAGGGKRIGFEGGQMPLLRRIPKRGFNNLFKREYRILNIQDLASKFNQGVLVSPLSLRQRGIIKGRLPVKILGMGEIGFGLEVKAHAFSKGAREKIEKAGGSCEEIKQENADDRK